MQHRIPERIPVADHAEEGGGRRPARRSKTEQVRGLAARKPAAATQAKEVQEAAVVTE